MVGEVLVMVTEMLVMVVGSVSNGGGSVSNCEGSNNKQSEGLVLMVCVSNDGRRFSNDNDNGDRMTG